MQVKVITGSTIRLGQMKVNYKFYSVFCERGPLVHKGDWNGIGTSSRHFRCGQVKKTAHAHMQAHSTLET